MANLKFNSNCFLGCNYTLIGDGFCNDETNNKACNYDGGDCCGNCINTENCIECLCHDENATNIDLSCKFSFFWGLK